MTNGIRTAIEMKNNAYKEYIRSGMRHNYYVRIENLTTGLSNLIRDTKTEYHSKLAAKLVNPSTSAKTYWSILKRDLPRKAILGIRFVISQKQKIVKTYMLFLQTN